MKQIKADVAIISAGTAGLAAAIAATGSGAPVIVLEKSNHTGGTAIMGNGLFAVESRLQRLKQYLLTSEEAFKYIWILLGIVIVAATIILLSSCGRKEQTSAPGKTSIEEKIDYYTCGMHPSVKVSPEEYNKGSVNCPICNMKLTPVYKEETDTKGAYYGCGVDTEGKCPRCDLGKPDAKCICGEHSFTIEGQKINCPVWSLVKEMS